MANTETLKDKVIVITGGSSGIGKATAKKCVQAGAHVALVAHQAERLESALKEIASVNPAAMVRSYLCDVADLSQVTVTGAKILRDFKNVDVLVNNAGATVYKTFAELSLEEIDQITRLNYLGALFFSKIFLDTMIQRGHGHIVNVASVGGALPITPSSVYGGAKHALTAMTEMLDYEYQSFNIDFSLFLPGRVDTPFFDHESFKRRAARVENSGILHVDVAAESLLQTIIRRKKKVIIPKFFYLVIWANAALPWFFKPLIKRIIKRRITDHYDQVGWPTPKKVR